jgi:hypothetical protein
MRITCWTPKSANTHSEYDIFIDFPLQQWLHESATMLRYTYIACLVIDIYLLKIIWKERKTEGFGLVWFLAKGFLITVSFC